jgi:membrane-bound lytic murein transglycosylase B
MRLRRLVVLPVLLLAVLAACSDAEPAAVSTTTSSSAPSTTTTTAPTTTTTTAPPGPPVAAADAAGLAVQAAAAERDARNPAVTGDALMRAGWTQQVVSRALAEKQSMLPSVLAAVPAEYRAAVEANVKAAVDLRALTKPRDKLPDNWRIVAPAPIDELLGHYRAAEKAIGVPWQYLASIHFVETKLGRIRGTSTAGAQGPMQFLPSTWTQYGGGGDINSNADAIMAAARMLKRNGAPERIDDALFSYNRSKLYVNAVKLYAQQMAADAQAFRGYFHWQVAYRMVDGDRFLLEGYPERAAVRA